MSRINVVPAPSREKETMMVMTADLVHVLVRVCVSFLKIFMFKEFFSLTLFHLLRFFLFSIHEVANFNKGKRNVSGDSMINSLT